MTARNCEYHEDRVVTLVDTLIEAQLAILTPMQVDMIIMASDYDYLM